MTDIDDLDLTPQQWSALRRADENPEHLTDYDVEILGGLLVDGEQTTRERVAGIVANGSTVVGGSPNSFIGLADPLITALGDENADVRKAAAEVLGQIGGEAPEQVEEATGPLIAALDDENPDVREAAAWALGRIGSEAPAQVEEATGPLIDTLGDENADVRLKTIRGLREIGREAPVQVETGPLIAALDDGNADVRKAAVVALREIGTTTPAQVEEVTGPLIAALNDEYPGVREAATRALSWIGREAPTQVGEAIGPLIAALDDQDSGVRKAAAEALRWIGNEAPAQVEEATGPLIAVLDDDNSDVRAAAAGALGQIGREAPEQVEEAIGPLIAALDDGPSSDRRNAFARKAATRALGKIGSEAPAQVEEATDPLIATLDDEDSFVRKAAAWALGRIGGEAPAQVGEATRPLIAALDDADADVREAAVVALGRIGSEAPEQVEEATDPLIAALDDEAWPVRGIAAESLGRIGGERPLPEAAHDAIRERLHDDSTEVQVAAGFARLQAAQRDEDTCDEAVQALRNGLTDADTVPFATDYVAELADDDRGVLTELEPALDDGLAHSASEVRRNVAELLGEVEIEDPLPALEHLAEQDEDQAVREAASEALAEIEGTTRHDPAATTTGDSRAPTGPETHVTNQAESETVPSPVAAAGSGDDLSYDDIQQEATLGRGAADVYEARIPDEEGSRRVVLKEPRFAGGLDEDTREGFLDEARYWAQVADHPHVVDLVAWGDDPHPWLVAEYLDGGDLSGRKLELDEALWLCARIADALHEAHTLGLRHFDLKPENVLLRRVEDNPWDVPKVADWGLARFQMEHSGRLTSFTPQYGAPEQFLPDEFDGLDNRTDLYQLGLVLYELTTGAHPFPDRSGRVVTERLEQRPQPPTELDGSLPARLDDIVGQLLEPRPADRYDSAAVVRNVLDRLRRGETVGQVALADRADLYANALEYARGESLRECQRWATEIAKFVRNNPVEDAAYETVQERVASFVDDWFAGRERTYGADHDIIVGGDVDIEVENPELHHDIADIAEEVRRLYMRSS